MFESDWFESLRMITERLNYLCGKRRSKEQKGERMSEEGMVVET